MRLARPLLAFLVLWTLLPSPSAAATDDVFLFEGGGWGHGVGLSQYGARGLAQAGQDASQILQFYYTGTSVSNSPLPGGHWLNQPEALWVGLVANTTSVELGAVGPNVVACQPAPDCSQVNEPINEGDDPWVFEYNSDDPSKCRFRRGTGEAGWNGGWGPCDAEVRQVPETTTRVTVNGKAYAHGTVKFTPLSVGFHAVVKVDLEKYLYGLAEMPSAWEPEALKAQAIIGRGYAVATAIERGNNTNGSGKLSSCGCHLRSTAADQVYNGWAAEAPAWRSAVNDTAGKVLTHPNSNYAYKIAKSFYGSSNGGASENVEDVWGGAALPWLRSVPDPYSANPSINPLARWGYEVNAANLATYLGWTKVTAVEVIAGPPGSKVRFTGTMGGTNLSQTLSGEQVRVLLMSPTIGAKRKYPGTSDLPVRVSPYIISVSGGPRFIDIGGSVFENAIIWLADQGITQGCNPPTNNKYCPNDSVTRGEMAIFIARALNLPNTSTNYFTDDNGKFYENAANKIAAAGITQGCGGTKFCGDRKVTRGEMAAFIARAFSLPSASQDYFIDDNGSMFENAINKIRKAGITEGCNPPTNNRYCPNDYVTRGQMAAFFKRALT